MCPSVGTCLKGLPATSWLPVVVFILILAATGCEDAGPADGNWLLELLDGQPVIEKSEVRMRIERDRIEGFDGCNHYHGKILVGLSKNRNGTPFTGPDGVFFLQAYGITKLGCEKRMASQADQYWSALIGSPRYRVADGRLEILVAGATRLVFVREAP